MSTVAKTKFTEKEYLALERNTDRKNEFWAGQIFAMDGGTANHNLIITNVASELRTQLKERPCKVYSSDMRVKVQKTGLLT